MSTSDASSVDAYYTPAWLADELAAALPHDMCGAVLDPTVGEGALLSAVGARFKQDVQLLGVDIDDVAVAKLRRERPDWIVSRADVLKPASRRASQAWRAASAEVTAVVTNPPFSYRGNGGSVICYRGFTGRAAPAMQFLLAALTDLRPTAGVFAVLPDGAMDAERHEGLWQAIEQDHVVTRLRRFKATSFRGARVATSLVRIVPGGRDMKTVEYLASERSAFAECRCVEVIRGRVPVHIVRRAEPENPAPFLHTTNVHRGGPAMFAESSLADDAPFLVINRIGKWRRPTSLDVGRAVLSDCLIALRPRSRGQIDVLGGDLIRAESWVAAEYRGTGAQYVTLAGVVRQLRRLGWHPHVLPAGASLGECCCTVADSYGCAKS